MALLLALASSAMWGIGDFIGGLITKRVHVAIVVGAQSFFGLLTVVLIGVFVDINITAELIPWAMLASLTGFSGLSMLYSALAIGRMGIVSPIAALGAIVPVAIGLTSGELPSSLQLIGIIVAIVGVVLASGPELSGGAETKPVLLAIGAAASFGLCLWAIARGSEYSVFGTMLIMRIQTSILCAAWIFTQRKKLSRSNLPWFALIVIGIFDIMANVAFGFAATQGLLSLTSVLGSLYPVVTVMMAFIILKERLLPVQYVGITAALLGVAAIAGG